MWILLDYNALLGLFTLVALEIILGIDNLIFISILSNQLPNEYRARARFTGVGLALGIRIALLTGISWLVTLTTPWFHIYSKGFSSRDIILIIGGLFLLFKAAMEINKRIKGQHDKLSPPKKAASFWGIIAQIILIDLVFSIDSIITAIGMTNNLPLMITAIILAILVMLIASKRLAEFINTRPSIMMLCLGFLILIACTLIIEGFGVHCPKGYIYVAIGFSLMIELFNQLARSNHSKMLIKKTIAPEH